MRDPRSDEMARLFVSGKSTLAIGKLYGLTGERVRQLISQDHGLRGQDGGARKAAALEKHRKSIARNNACLERYGCSLEQYAALRGDPIRKFTSQKGSAKQRGVEWRLSLWQWWCIWSASGKWELRGRGQGYVMCRNGDTGAYEDGNVFIGLAPENSSEAQRKNSSLPVGVKKNARYAGYSSTRYVNGVRHHLGTFPTPELARAAYVAVATPPQQCEETTVTGNRLDNVIHDHGFDPPA